MLNFIKKPGVLFMSSVPFRISLPQLVKGGWGGGGDLPYDLTGDLGK